jgi:uncharacterized pyridoxamine 5'-phosphate oxidase family protein
MTMEKDVLDLIGKLQFVYLATVDGGQARVRPFGFMGLRDGKLWFCTARDKEVFAQLSQNPQVEFAYTFAPEMVTLRIRGAVSLDDDMEVKKGIIERSEVVRSIYGSADNPRLVAFCIPHGQAIIADIAGKDVRRSTF